MVGERHFYTITGQAFGRMCLLGALALFFSPIAGLVEQGSASAQTYRSPQKYAKRLAPGHRLVIKNRKRLVRKPRKSLFGGLFGGKPAYRRGPGIKPLFGSFNRPATSRQSPAALRNLYEKRMIEAGRRGGGLMKASRNSGDWSSNRRQKSPWRWGSGRYRTMCVRMCDGYYFPVRFKARSKDFNGDEERCNSECYNAPTKLFYYSNPGGSIENMRSLDGVRYKDIANAFKYRKEFVADCRCKAEPWTPQARQQHESWASEEKSASVAPL